jgi:hypothetical protein
MKLTGFLECVSLIGLGFHLLRQCSDRFMPLRRAKSITPYLYAIAGIFSMVLITLALPALCYFSSPRFGDAETARIRSQYKFATVLIPSGK